MLLLGTFFYCIASALIPVLNAEVYIAAMGATGGSALLLALVGGAGQMVGKVFWYYAGAGGTKIPAIARTMAKPAWQARLHKWQGRILDRPVKTVGLLFLSSFVGLPPFAVISVLAGVLEIRLWIFLVTGLAGRFLRFWIILSGAGYLLDWSHW